MNYVNRPKYEREIVEILKKEEKRITANRFYLGAKVGFGLAAVNVIFDTAIIAAEYQTQAVPLGLYKFSVGDFLVGSLIFGGISAWLKYKGDTIIKPKH